LKQDTTPVENFALVIKQVAQYFEQDASFLKQEATPIENFASYFNQLAYYFEQDASCLKQDAQIFEQHASSHGIFPFRSNSGNLTKLAMV